MRLRTVLGTSMILALALLVSADVFLLPAYRPLVPALMLALALGGWYEFVGITGLSRPPKGGPELGLLGGAAVAWFFVLAWLGAGAPGREDAGRLASLLLLVFAAFAAAVLPKDFLPRYPAVLETIAAALLLGLFLSYLVTIYRIPGIQGPVYWAVLMGGVKGNDIAAYYVGKTWGKHHPFPVSPQKTIEGSIGAISFSLAYFGIAWWALGTAFPESHFRWPGGMLFGVTISVAAQAGDLAESLVKRAYQVKDSSRLLPEFGGVLDLVDSLVFAGPVFWFWGAS